MAEDNGSSLGRTNDDFIKFDYSDKHKADKYKSNRKIKQILKDKTKSSIRSTSHESMHQNLGPDASTGSPDTGPWDEHQGGIEENIELGDYEKSIGGAGGTSAFKASGDTLQSVFKNTASTAVKESTAEGLSQFMSNVLSKQNPIVGSLLGAAGASGLKKKVVTPTDIDPRGPLGHSEEDPYSTSKK